MRGRLWLIGVLLLGAVAAVGSCARTEQAHGPTLGGTKTTPAAAVRPRFALLEATEEDLARGVHSAVLRVNPGSETQAREYYTKIRAALTDFPRQTLLESSIADMLAYYGFPALLPEDLQRLAPAFLMDFARLRVNVSNKDPFESAWPWVRAWLEAEPDRLGRELFERLQGELPGVYPDGQLRTFQRRAREWRLAAARQLVFASPSENVA